MALLNISIFSVPSTDFRFDMSLNHSLETFSPVAASRRSFLRGTSALVAAVSIPSLVLAADESSQSKSLNEPVKLSVNFKQALFRVRLELDVEGNVNLPENPLVSRKSTAVLPLKSEAVFDYEERYRRPEGADQDSLVTASERYYHEAASVHTLNKKRISNSLRPEASHAIVRRDQLPEIVYSTTETFTQDELSLLKVPASSIAVDGLLPTVPVVAGDQYIVDEERLRSLLNLSSIAKCEVKGEVVLVTQTEARIQLRGDVDGSVDGVPTKIRVVGKMTFDRKNGFTNWLAMAVHETREIGKAEPGFDVAATIKMLRQPLAQPVKLAKKPYAVDVTATIPEDRLFIELQSDHLRIRMPMDRRWRMMSDKPGAAMMRMIENERSIAQCDFRSLSKLEPGKQWTMDALQQDIKKTLGEQWRAFETSNEMLSESGLRVMTVVARGAVQEIPIRWIVQHFSDDSGRRVLATFTMEEEASARFATSNVELESRLRFIETGSMQKKDNNVAGERKSPPVRIGTNPTASPSDRKK